MSWLLHNVVADMYGPYFLAFYATVIGAVIIACYKSVRSVDQTGFMGLPEIPAKLDPYEVAYLRGGENEVARVAIASLVQRGLLQVTERKIFLTKTKEIALGREPSANELRPIEERVMRWSGFPAQPQSIFQPGGIPPLLKEVCGQYETELAQRDLLAPRAQMKEAAVRMWLIGSSLILGLGGYKLWAALTKGHHNVVFLLILGLFGVVTLAIVCMAVLPRISHRGKAYLLRLRLAYGELKSQVDPRGEPGQALFADGDRGKAQAVRFYSDALLLVGIYGITALASTLPELKTMFARSASSSDGCGGGCGGCGGWRRMWRRRMWRLRRLRP